MTNLVRFILGVAFFILSCFECYSEHKEVLVLHSYNSGLSWTDGINKAIFDSFKAEYQRSVDLRCEFMDAKHFSAQPYFENFKEYIEKKYAGIRFDLIIAVDNSAFSFLNDYKESLFGDVPVVFCGLNNVYDIPEGYTGIMEEIYLKENIELILQLHPDYEKLYIVNDKSQTGLQLHLELQKVISTHFQDLKYEILSDYSFDELKQKLAQGNEHEITLFLLFNFDRFGETYSYDVILDDITPICKMPVYGTWEFYLNQGIIGGKIIKPYDQGLLASGMAKEVLNGKPVDEIPIQVSEAHYVFDYKRLDQHGISVFQLPTGSQLINHPYEFFIKNKQLSVLVSITFLLLIACIILLINRIANAKSNLAKEITLKKQIEIALQNQKEAHYEAEEANRLKSVFLANISHEFRTPLNGILGFIDLLETSTDQQINIHYFDIIRKSSNQLLRIVTDIVDVSKIDSNQVKLLNSTFSINQFMQKVYYSHLSDTKNMDLKLGKFELTDGEDDIELDSSALKKVIDHLIYNAIKFCRDGTVEFGYRLIGEQLEIYVKDTGIGMDSRFQSKIFDRFYQIPQDNNFIYGGNGIGLSIVKAYLDLMEGRIRFQSKIGEGSEFTVVFSKVRSSHAQKAMS